jgi:hypothetical protein
VEPATGEVGVTYLATFEIEGQAKPGCVAEVLFRYYPPAHQTEEEGR